MTDFVAMSSTRGGFTPHLKCFFSNADNPSYKSNLAHKKPASPNLGRALELQQKCHLCSPGRLGNHHTSATANSNVHLFYTGCYEVQLVEKLQLCIDFLLFLKGSTRSISVMPSSN